MRYTGTGGRNLRRVHGLILHRTPVREKDRVVDVFTREEGRLRLFAPGVRHITSRRAGHLEPLMETVLVVSHTLRGDTVSDARVARTFPRLRDQFDRLHTAYAVVKNLQEYTGEHLRDPLLYDAILRIFRTLDASSPLSPLLREAAQVHILRSFGALPDLYRCSQCRKQLVLDAFSFKGGRRGFVCESCDGRRDPTLTNVVKILRLLLADPTAKQLHPDTTVIRRVRDVVRTLLHSQGVSHLSKRSPS